MTWHYIFGYADDANIRGRFRGSDHQTANEDYRVYVDAVHQTGCKTNAKKSFLYSAHQPLHQLMAPPNCTLRPCEEGIITLGVPQGSDAVIARTVAEILAPRIAQVNTLRQNMAKPHPEETLRILEQSYVPGVEFLIGAVPPTLAREAFDAFATAVNRCRTVALGFAPPPAYFWPQAEGGRGCRRLDFLTRCAMYLRQQQAAVDITARLDPFTHQHIMRPGSLWHRRIAAARAAIHPQHPLHCASLAMATESSSPTPETRAVFASAVDAMHSIHMREEREALTDEQRHILAGSKSSPNGEVFPWHNRSLVSPMSRMPPDYFRSASALAMAVCPPILWSLTKPGDPLGRNCLISTPGGGMTRRHGPIVDEVHTCEQIAGRLTLREVGGLYAHSSRDPLRRVDTCSISAVTGDVDTTDETVTDPHTERCRRHNTSISASLTAAEARKDAKYSRPDDMPSTGNRLHPIALTTQGVMGLRGETYIKMLASETVQYRDKVPEFSDDFQQRVRRVYARFRCRISLALAKGLGLQVSIYALERRLPGGLKQFVQRHREAIPLPVLDWTTLETLPAVAQARRCPRAGGTVRH